MGQLPPIRRASVRQAKSQSRKGGEEGLLLTIARDGLWGPIGVFVGILLTALPSFLPTQVLIQVFYVVVLIFVGGAFIVWVLFRAERRFLAFLFIAVMVVSSSFILINFTKASNKQSNTNSPGETLELYHGHHGSIKSLLWSSDGKRITSYSSDGTVQTWDATTGNNPVVRKYYDQTLGADVTEIPSPDGKLVASLSILPVPPWPSPSYDIRFSQGEIKIFDAVTGADVLAHDRKIFSGINQLAWSPDTKSNLIASSNEGIISVWNAKTGKNVSVYTGNDIQCCPVWDFVYGLAWSPDGRFIASSGDDGEIKIWEAATGKLYTKYPSHCLDYEGNRNGRVYNIDWQADGSGTSRMTFGCSDYNGYEHDEVIKILSVAIDYYASDSSSVFSIEEVSQAILCHMDKIDARKRLLNHVLWDLSSDDKYIAYSCRDSSMISILDIARKRDVFTYPGHHDAVTTLAWSPNGQYIASGSKDETIQVWRPV